MNRIYEYFGWAIITALMIALLAPAIAASKEKENVVYKYKQYEFIDLSNMKVDGQLVAPGDISVKTRSRREFSRQLYDRKHFKDILDRDLQTLR